MRGASDVRTTLCRNFCGYYKPGKDEELECRGSVVVRRLRAQGLRISLARPKTAKVPGRKSLDDVKARVCAACPFREADCDFILTQGAAPPCGGVALLLHLLAGGGIAPEDLDRR